jgi:dTDP-4-amino-4,6-dideoxygalactose transaminase
MKVPYFSNIQIPDSNKVEWAHEISRVINSESLISGKSVEKFEIEFARFVGTEFGIGVGNGLDGLTLSLRAAGLGPGHVVAVPAHTFIATFLAVIHVGAIPYAVDVDSEGLLDLTKLFELKIRVDAVIPVHLHGCMVDMKTLSSWAQQRGIIVIEDASQAHGCRSNEVNAGQLGDLAVFSLYPTKNLGALGDAGIVVTSNADYRDFISSSRTYGSSKESKYSHVRLGYNSRMDTIQAAVLSKNLAHLDNWNLHRNRLAEIYRKQLSGLPVKTLINEKSSSVYHHFPILLANRDGLREYLSTHDIGSEIHYPNLASTEVAALASIDLNECPNAREISISTLSLPISQWHSEDEIVYVTEVISRFFGG